MSKTYFLHFGFAHPCAGKVKKLMTVRFTSEWRTPKMLLAQLSLALGDWVRNTEDGRAAWEESGHNFTMDYLLEYLTEDESHPFLWRYLREYGIYGAILVHSGPYHLTDQQATLLNNLEEPTYAAF